MSRDKAMFWNVVWARGSTLVPQMMELDCETCWSLTKGYPSSPGIFGCDFLAMNCGKAEGSMNLHQK
jgi:hypothetical protein